MEFRFELPDGYSYQDVLALMRVLIRKRKFCGFLRLTKHKSYRIMNSVQTLRSGAVADFNGQERGRTVQALPDGQ